MSVTTPTVFTIYPAQAAELAAIGATGDAGRIDDTDLEAVAYNATHAYAYNTRTVLEHTRLTSDDRIQGTDSTYTPLLECTATLGADRVGVTIHYRRTNCDLQVQVYEDDGTTLDASATDTTGGSGTDEGSFQVTGITVSDVVIVVSAKTNATGTYSLEKLKITEDPLTTSDLP